MTMKTSCCDNTDKKENNNNEKPWSNSTKKEVFVALLISESHWLANAKRDLILNICRPVMEQLHSSWNVFFKAQIRGFSSVSMLKWIISIQITYRYFVVIVFINWLYDNVATSQCLPTTTGWILRIWWESFTLIKWYGKTTVDQKTASSSHFDL